MDTKWHLSFVVLFHKTLSESEDLMKIKSILSGLLLAALATAASAPLAQTLALASNQSSLASTTWLVKVEGEPRTRTLIITGEAPSAEGAFLQAKYGMSDQSQGPIAAEIRKVGTQRQLELTTQAGTKIVAAQQQNGTFQGTFTLKGGAVKSVTIEPASSADLQTARVSPSADYQKPGADVPADCAVFVGVWSGEWPNIGRTWLWVANADKSCTLKYSYGTSAIPPKSFKTAEVKGGILSLQRPDGGTTTFKVQGDSIVGQYSGPAGVNGVTMQKVQPDAVAQLRTEQIAANVTMPPAANVPPDCAGYYGTWVGNWSQGGIREQYFRVTSVEANGEKCIAKYAYSGSKTAPANQTLEIQGRSITFGCNPSTGGTCIFARNGDVISASYSNPGGGINNGTFRRVQ